MNTEHFTSDTNKLHQSTLQTLTSPPALTESRLSLSGNESYYRSKIFVATTGPNLLVAAAATLLTMVSRLRDSDTYADLNDLYQHLVHEVKAFESAAHKQGYRSEFILVARYVLCATLDETILKTAWGHESHWKMHTLLATFQSDNQGDDRFFLIIDRLLEDAALYVDLLELMYICLSLGFEGKYREQDNGRKHLEDIRENLYQRITRHRDELENELSAMPLDQAPSYPVYTQRLPLWLMYAFTLVVLLGVYASFNYFLGAHLSPLLQELATNQPLPQQVSQITHG